MALNYNKDLIELNKSIYKLEDYLEEFDKHKTEGIKRDINIVIQEIRGALNSIKVKVNNYYIGGI